MLDGACGRMFGGSPHFLFVFYHNGNAFISEMYMFNNLIEIHNILQYIMYKSEGVFLQFPIYHTNKKYKPYCQITTVQARRTRGGRGGARPPHDFSNSTPPPLRFRHNTHNDMYAGRGFATSGTTYRVWVIECGL